MGSLNLRNAYEYDAEIYNAGDGLLGSTRWLPELPSKR